MESDDPRELERMEHQESKRLPLTRIQKLIGHLMLESKQTKAAGYLSVWADVTDLPAMRKKYSRKTGVRVTTNDLLLYAMARALREIPLPSAVIDRQTDELVIPERIGLGFAVAAPQGLVVPVIQDACGKTLTELAQATDALLRRARANQLLPDDFEGANLVLSGLGMYGIEWFYAIAPPSATGIVSIGYIADHLVPINGKTEVRKRLNVSLAVDQCVADDFTAARFLRRVVDRLEDPWSMTD